jgi:glyoxylase-like metal-dependent hydrolase (beta-lactamase superfamily II)
MSESTPPLTERVTERGIERVQEHIYLVRCPFPGGGLSMAYYIDAPQPALIDSGVVQSVPEVIEPGLAAIGRRIEDIRYILNTHGHWDHVGGNEQVRRRSGAAVLVHAADAAFLRDEQAHMQGYYTVAQRQLGWEHELPERRAVLRRCVEFGRGPDRPLADGDTIDLGGGIRLQVVHVPGHSLGHVAFWWPDAGVLFSADAIQCRGSRPGGLPLVFEDAAAYRTSLDRLAALRPRILCMGHAFVWSQEPRLPVRRGDEVAATIEESRQVIEQVRAAVQRALALDPEAPFLHVARAALAELAGPLALQLDPAHGIAVQPMATLYCLWRELRAAV